MRVSTIQTNVSEVYQAFYVGTEVFKIK